VFNCGCGAQPLIRLPENFAREENYFAEVLLLAQSYRVPVKKYLKASKTLRGHRPVSQQSRTIANAATHGSLGPCTTTAVLKKNGSEFTSGVPVKNTSGLAPRSGGRFWALLVRESTACCAQKVAMRPNGWLYKITLLAIRILTLILISSFSLGTILIQFHPPRT
jgi:hypothetical protein